MLLRSSSNSVFEPLSSSLASSHAELLPEHVRSERTAGDFAAPKSLSFTARGCSSSTVVATNCLSKADPHSNSGNSVGCSPIGRMRKVFSENDLCTFAAGASESPGLVAANSFVQDDKIKSSHLEVRSHHLPYKEDRISLPLNRWRSLGSCPSDLPSILFSSGSAILEEVESVSVISSATSGEVEEKEGGIWEFVDKLALPVGRTRSIVVEDDDVRKNDDSSRNDEDGKEELSMEVSNPGFELSMAEDAGSWRNTLPKMEMRGAEGALGGFERNSSQPKSYASSSGRQEPLYTIGQGASRLSKGREGGRDTAVLDPQVHGETSYAYHREAWEVVTHGAGDGGRGVRPPTSAGDGGGQGRRNSDPTELHYQTALKENPGHALILQNYAQYLAEVKQDYRKAEEFFQRAILANPSDGELLSSYAKVLWEGQQDRERAASYFERAVQAAPDNSYVVAAYASFLWSAEEEEEEQESLEEAKDSNPANVPGATYNWVSASVA